MEKCCYEVECIGYLLTQIVFMFLSVSSVSSTVTRTKWLRWRTKDSPTGQMSRAGDETATRWAFETRSSLTCDLSVMWSKWWRRRVEVKMNLLSLPSFFRDQGEEPPTGRTPAPNAGTIASATGSDQWGDTTTATALQVTEHLQSGALKAAVINMLKITRYQMTMWK